MLRFKNTIMLVFIFLLTFGAGPALGEEEKTEAPRDLSGRWTVHLRNSLGTKICTFDIEQEDARLRARAGEAARAATRANKMLLHTLAKHLGA